GVGGLEEWGKPPRRSARPVKDAPQAASAAAATVDLFYEMENTDHLRPGQRVAVTLPLRGEEESVVVPWSAIVFDIHGGTWVYEQESERVFIRRRVHVQYVVGTTAVLASGPPAGVKIVIDVEQPLEVGKKIVIEGVAELFGAEV